MLLEHLTRFPSRPRTLVIKYARPRLVDWELPTDVAACIHLEEQFRLVTHVRATSTLRMQAAAAFDKSLLVEWTVKVETGQVDLVIRRDRIWIELVCVPNPQRQSWQFAFVDVCGSITLEHTTPPLLTSYEPNVFRPGRVFRFSADLRNNLFSVFFDPYCVQCIVPDLASYRPCCYFRDADASLNFLD